MSRSSLFFTVIAAVLIGGFAWLEFHQPLAPFPLPQSQSPDQLPSAYEVLEQLRKTRDRKVEVAVSGPGGRSEVLVIDASSPEQATQPTADPNEVKAAKELLEKAREQRRQDRIIKIEEGDDSGDLDDDTKFERLLDQVRRPEGFSKRFEVDTVKALRERGYNPDGSPVDLNLDPDLDPEPDQSQNQP